MYASYVIVKAAVHSKSLSAMFARIVLQSQVLGVVVVVTFSFLGKSSSTFRLGALMVLDPQVSPLYVSSQDCFVVESASTIRANMVPGASVRFQMLLQRKRMAKFLATELAGFLCVHSQVFRVVVFISLFFLTESLSTIITRVRLYPPVSVQMSPQGTWVSEDSAANLTRLLLLKIILGSFFFGEIA